MGQAGSTFQHWCCLTLLIIRPCFQLLITFSCLDWNFPHWISASGWFFWNFLAQTVAIFENRSNGNRITFNIWKILSELSFDSTSMLSTESTNPVNDGLSFKEVSFITLVRTVQSFLFSKKSCSLHALETWAPQGFISCPPVSRVSNGEKVD